MRSCPLPLFFFQPQFLSQSKSSSYVHEKNYLHRNRGNGQVLKIQIRGEQNEKLLSASISDTDGRHLNGLQFLTNWVPKSDRLGLPNSNRRKERIERRAYLTKSPRFSRGKLAREKFPCRHSHRWDILFDCYCFSLTFPVREGKKVKEEHGKLALWEQEHQNIRARKRRGPSLVASELTSSSSSFLLG